MMVDGPSKFIRLLLILCCTFQGTWVSMGVYSDGSYNVPAGLIYSFPVTCKNGEWSIVQGENMNGDVIIV